MVSSPVFVGDVSGGCNAMKVVGGPSDGIDVWMGEGKRHIQLLDPPTFSYVTSYDYNNHKDRVHPTVSLASYTTYTVRVIRGNRGLQKSPEGDIIYPEFDELRFLAPQDWSDFKAIHFQFTK